MYSTKYLPMYPLCISITSPDKGYTRSTPRGQYFSTKLQGRTIGTDAPRSQVLVIIWLLEKKCPFLGCTPLVKDGHISCKVGFAAKVHTEENVYDLDGAFLRVILVVTQQNEYVGDRHRMYRNYESTQATIIHVSQVSIQFDV